MNDRRTIWLLLLLLAITAVANFLLFTRSPSPRSIRNRSLLDPSFDIRSIVLERPNEPALTISHADHWRIVSPFASKADEQAVLQLTDAFVSTQIDDVYSDAELLKLGRTRDDFGFAEKNLTVTFSDGQQQVTLAFGDSTPSSNGVYVAVNGLDAVLVVSSRILSFVSGGADAFRERDIFPFEPDFVRGFDVKRANASIIGITHEGDSWQIGGSPASGVKVREFLTLVSEATARDFLWPTGSADETDTISSARLSAYGLDAETAVSVVFHCLDGSDRRLLFGLDIGTEKSYALIHEGAAIVTLDSSLKSALLQGERAFSDSRLFPVEESTVRSFSILNGDTAYILSRDANNVWRLESPVVAPAASDAVSAVLGRLVSLTTGDLVPFGFKVAVSTNLLPCVVAPASVLGEVRLDDLRSKEILSIDPTRIRRLVSTFGGDSAHHPTAVVYSRERRMWDVETDSDEGSEHLADEAGIRTVLAALQSLQAVRIESICTTPAALTRYGLETPYCSIAVDQEKEGALRRNILIGAESGDGGRFATVGSSDAIFVLSKKSVEALTSPLVEN